MQIQVRLELDDGRVAILVPGDIVGRAPRAALRLNDPTISEAHSMVSLRGSSLRLIALRGRFIVGSERLSDLALEAGQRIAFSPTISAEVLDVALPEAVLALESDEHGRLIPPPVASLFAAGDGVLPGFSSDADAVLWVDGEVMHLRSGEGPDRTLRAGDVFEVGGRRWSVIAVPLDEAAVVSTAASGPFSAPLALDLYHDSVHVNRGREVFAVGGFPARIITELALAGVPVEWATVAREVWGPDVDANKLRMNWDAALSRLRRRLREHGVRANLLRTDGRGLVELLLGPDDRVRDRT